MMQRKHPKTCWSVVVNTLCSVKGLVLLLLASDSLAIASVRNETCPMTERTCEPVSYPHSDMFTDEASIGFTAGSDAIICYTPTRKPPFQHSALQIAEWDLCGGPVHDAWKGWANNPRAYGLFNCFSPALRKLPRQPDGSVRLATSGDQTGQFLAPSKKN